MCKESIIEKIKNLLNKTIENGATEAEALNALSLARKLMLKYKISQSDVDSKNIEKNIVNVKLNYNIHVKWIFILIDIITKNFGIILYVNKASRKSYPILFGEEQDVEAVKNIFEYAYKFAEESSNKYSTEYRKIHGSSLGIKNDWLIGFLKGLNDKYEEQNKSDESFALMTTTSLEVKNKWTEYKNGSNLNFTKTSINTSMKHKNDYNAMQAGYVEGKNFGFKEIE